MHSDYQSSILVVSNTDKACEFLRSLLPDNRYGNIISAHSAGEAARILLDKPFDIVVINAPLKDDFGTETAINFIQEYNCGVLLMVKSDMYESVSFDVTDYGILTLARPCTGQDLKQAIRLMEATSARLRAMKEKTENLEQKMREVRVISRAKGILMEHQKMSEEEAHRYLEKAAMDNCVKKADIAMNLIHAYGN